MGGGGRVLRQLIRFALTKVYSGYRKFAFFRNHIGVIYSLNLFLEVAPIPRGGIQKGCFIYSVVLVEDGEVRAGRTLVRR